MEVILNIEKSLYTNVLCNSGTEKAGCHLNARLLGGFIIYANQVHGGRCLCAIKKRAQNCINSKIITIFSKTINREKRMKRSKAKMITISSYDSSIGHF